MLNLHGYAEADYTNNVTFNDRYINVEPEKAELLYEKWQSEIREFVKSIVASQPVTLDMSFVENTPTFGMLYHFSENGNLLKNNDYLTKCSIAVKVPIKNASSSFTTYELNIFVNQLHYKYIHMSK